MNSMRARRSKLTTSILCGGDRGCPILAQREVREYNVEHWNDSRDFKRLDGGDSKDTSRCRKFCRTQKFHWKEKS